MQSHMHSNDNVQLTENANQIPLDKFGIDMTKYTELFDQLFGIDDNSQFLPVATPRLVSYDRIKSSKFEAIQELQID